MPQLLAVLANHTGGNLYVAEPMVWQDEAAGVTDARAREENLRNADVAGKSAGRVGRGPRWCGRRRRNCPMCWARLIRRRFRRCAADRDTMLVGRTPAELTAPVDADGAGAGGRRQAGRSRLGREA